MKKFLSILLCVFTSIAYSQVVNIENRRLGDGTYGFSGMVDMALSAQKQKDLLLSFEFKPLIQYKFNGKKHAISKDTSATDSTHKASPFKYKHLVLLVNDIKYTGAKNQTYANFGMLHFRYAYRIANSSWKWETYSQIQYNQLLLQKMRYILGSGLRVKIIDVETKEGEYSGRATRIFAGTSLFYEYEEVNYKERPIEYNNAVRWSTYISTYLNFKYFEFASTTYIQPNIARFKDVKLSGEYSVLFRVSEPFSIKFSLSHYNDSEPPETVIPSTFSFRVGFTYKLDNFKVDPDKIKKLKPKEVAPVFEIMDE